VRPDRDWRRRVVLDGVSFADPFDYAFDLATLG
jgi:hypothetical protein